MVDFYEYSTPELVRLLGNRFKEYRIRCNLTQKDVSEQSGIGLTTIHKFENGTAGNISLSTFIAVSYTHLDVYKRQIQSRWQSVLDKGKFLQSRDGSRFVSASSLSSALSAIRGNMTSVAYGIRRTIGQLKE